MADEASAGSEDRRMRLPFGLLAGVLAALAIATPASAAGYELARTWEVSSPSAIAVDGDRVYVTTSSAFGDRVTRFTTAGERVTAWGSDGDGPGQFNSPSGVTVGPDRNVFVIDLERRFQGFDPNGTLLGAASLGGLIANDIDIDATGDVYITHTTLGDPPQVVRFSAAGQVLAVWGSEGGGDGQLSSGNLGVASDGRGNVYVADVSNYRIQRFTNTGAYVGQWGQIGSGPGEFIDPDDVAVDERGDVYVADNLNGRVQTFSPSGSLREIIDLRASTGAVSNTPIGVDVDPQGNVYVADDGNPEAVYVYRPSRSGGQGPRTRITKAPKKKLRTSRKAKTVKVRFKSERGAKFECRLDKRKFKRCKSPYKAKANAKGGKGKTHRIQVRARDSAGDVGKPATAKFRVVRKGRGRG